MFYAERSDPNELYHFGVKGMKWGVRRYQNKDGSLTPKGKERVSKRYRKYMNRAEANVKSGQHTHGVTRRAMNKVDSLTDDYNKAYDKEFGKREKTLKYFNKNARMDGYRRLNSIVTLREQKVAELEAYQNDKNYKKAQSLSKKYKMESFDDFAKERNDYISKLKKSIDEHSDPIGEALELDRKGSTKRLGKKDAKGIINDNLATLNRYDKVFRDYPDFSFDKVYEEMKVDKNSKDFSTIDKAEKEWLKKHGY